MNETGITRMQRPASVEATETFPSSRWKVLDEYSNEIANITRDSCAGGNLVLRYWDKNGESQEKRLNDIVEAENWARENIWAPPIVLRITTTEDGTFKSHIALTRDHKWCVGHIVDWGNGHSVAIWDENGSVQISDSRVDPTDLLTLCRHVLAHADIPN